MAIFRLTARSAKGNCHAPIRAGLKLVVPYELMHSRCIAATPEDGTELVDPYRLHLNRLILYSSPDSPFVEARIIGIARCIIAGTAEESDTSRCAIGFRYYIGNWGRVVA